MDRAFGLTVRVAVVLLTAAGFGLAVGTAVETLGNCTLWAAGLISIACGAPAALCMGCNKGCWPPEGAAADVTDGGTLSEAGLRHAAGDAAVWLGRLCSRGFCLEGGTAAGGCCAGNLDAAGLFGVADGLGGVECDCQASC